MENRYKTRIHQERLLYIVSREERIERTKKESGKLRYSCMDTLKELCLFLKTESRYKDKLIAESCFHLHKILDSVLLGSLHFETAAFNSPNINLAL